MEITFLCVIVFLFLLAIFDLTVGVSNDAVNFLNSAIGSKAAPTRRILIVASIGVFIGAAMSDGMMDIARHGIFRPEHFSFYDLICIFMAVVVTNVLLLDIFNTLGMPTSTTVSMVFELLGATFVVSLIRMAGGLDLGLSELINTEKVLSVTIGIFLSVAVAFVFGTLVQFIARMIFTFNYRSGLKWKIGLFGGVCMTALIYFLVVKGVRDMSFMTPSIRGWIDTHTWEITGCSLVVFTLVMQLLYALGVNVLKVVVLSGTFALAMAFAGNDLVNFIGVPLSGLASYQDYVANGGGDARGFLMDSLNGPSETPVYFLVGAGAIMVVALSTSRKSRNVSKTEVGLGSQGDGDEMFGSSRIARRLVRWSLSVVGWVRSVMPQGVRRWFGRRFDVDGTVMESGASFDLVRGSVNLVLAGALIALGTSLKLPLSTTFVTFMVAMGTSLSDRAWGRESAVFRITGVISVVGGWFLTAGAAFIGAGIIVAMMHFGGHWVVMALSVITIFLIVRSNRRFNARREDDRDETLFRAVLATDDRDEAWSLLKCYITEQQLIFMDYARSAYADITAGFVGENPGVLSKAVAGLGRQKSLLKNIRRRETLCLQRVDRKVAIEKSTWFYLSNNCCMSMLYNLRRIAEVCHEHVDNNFRPLPVEYAGELEEIRARVEIMYNDVLSVMRGCATDAIVDLRRRCDGLKNDLSDMYHRRHSSLHETDPSLLSVTYVYINLLQETREMVSGMRKYLRAYGKLQDSGFTAR